MSTKSRINRYNFWIALYVFVSLLELVGELFSQKVLINATKPLLMPILIVFVFQNTKFKSPLISLYIALLFSAIGDDLLLFSSLSDIYFLLGLLSFLVTQVFYCFIFYKLIKWKKNRKISLILVFFYFSYLLCFLSLVFPYFGELIVPVLIYAFVIAIMGLLGFISGFQSNNNFIILGSILFVISDSFIALNKFYFVSISSDFLQVIIMLTYVIAQFFLAVGITRKKHQL